MAVNCVCKLTADICTRFLLNKMSSNLPCNNATASVVNNALSGLITATNTRNRNKNYNPKFNIDRCNVRMLMDGENHQEHGTAIVAQDLHRLYIEPTEDNSGRRTTHSTSKGCQLESAESMESVLLGKLYYIKVRACVNDRNKRTIDTAGTAALQ